MLRSARTALAVAAALLATAVASAPASAASCSIRATLKAPNHSPRANKDWWVTVTASPRIKTHAKYQFLFNDRVVSTQYVRYDRNYTFTGHFRDPLRFPKRATGLPLTLRVVLTNRCGTRNLDWKVKVRP